MQLARGERLEDSADALGVAIGTARNQLKQIFAKTDTHRQAELVRRILSGPSRFGVDLVSPDVSPCRHAELPERSVGGVLEVDDVVVGVTAPHDCERA